MQILATFNASNDVSTSSGHSISIVEAWGFHLSRNRYYNRVTEGSDWNGANPEDFGLLMIIIGPELSSATKS